jgi:hypothetical protein
MISWVERLPETVTKIKLQDTELTDEQINGICAIIDEKSIEIQGLVFQLFHSLLVPQIVNKAWFFLEAWLLKKPIDEPILQSIEQKLTETLNPSSVVGVTWNWAQGNPDTCEYYYYRLRVLRVLARKSCSKALTVTLSFHINPHVPWSDEINSRIVSLKVDTSFDEFYPNLKPYLLKQLPQQTRLQGGLTPRLGYGGVKSEILQQDVLANWKKTHLNALSMIYFTIINYKENWTIASSFLLNLFDDHEPEFKIQALHLLQLFLVENPGALQKSGLHVKFKEAVKVCLSYIPNSTPPETSVRILSLAYSCMFQLISSDSTKELIQYLNSSILSPISTMSNRYKSDYPLLVVCIDQITRMTTTYFSTKILVSFTKVNYALNQLLTNSFIVDNTEGLNVYKACLRCQQVIIEEFVSLEDEEGKELFLNYKYDLLGAWIVLAQRLEQNEVTDEKLTSQLKSNFDSLNKLTDLDSTLLHIYEKTPQVKRTLTRYLESK